MEVRIIFTRSFPVKWQGFIGKKSQHLMFFCCERKNNSILLRIGLIAIFFYRSYVEFRLLFPKNKRSRSFYIYVKCVLDIFIIGLIKSTGKGRIPSSLVQERLINLFLDVELNEMSRFLKFDTLEKIKSVVT